MLSLGRLCWSKLVTAAPASVGLDDSVCTLGTFLALIGAFSPSFVTGLMDGSVPRIAHCQYSLNCAGLDSDSASHLTQMSTCLNPNRGGRYLRSSVRAMSSL